MNNDNEVKSKILAHASEMFQRYGFTKITMEEIASELGISKKTLYKNFSNKEHILKEIINEAKCEITSFVEDLIHNKKIDFIEKLKMFMNFLIKHSSKLNSPMVQELAKNYPKLWDDIQELRKKKALKNFTLLIDEGINLGIFREDINKEVVVLLYISAIHGIINPETLSQLPVSGGQVFENIIKIIFEGILSKDGRKKYKTKLLVNLQGDFKL